MEWVARSLTINNNNIIDEKSGAGLDEQCTGPLTLPPVAATVDADDDQTQNEIL